MDMYLKPWAFIALLTKNSRKHKCITSDAVNWEICKKKLGV